MKSMKLAVISDIHANLEALYSFINYINQEKIELVLNLGDFVSNGPNPCEVFDLLMNDKRFINIKGYDENSLFNENELDEGIGQGRWLREKLGQKRLNQLKEMPITKELKINGKSILLCHHNGWSAVEQLAAHTHQLKYEKYDFLMCGGSHEQELSNAKGQYHGIKVIGPGAIGGSEDEKAYFATLTFDREEPVINFQCIGIEHSILALPTTKALETFIGTIDKEESSKTYYIYINGHKENSNDKQYIEDEVLEKVLEIGIKRCRYISIGCWSNEKQLIKEILYHLKCRQIKNSGVEGQEWYMGRITEDVIELLVEKRNLLSGRLKWFEISFYQNDKDISPQYSIFNYGKKSLLKEVSEKELKGLTQLLEKYTLSYTLPKQEDELEM